MAKKNTITLPDGTVVSHKKPLKEQMYKYRWFYLMFLPVFIFVVVFYYLPMFGIVYSFTEYKLIKDPVWTGFKNFETLFSKPMFWRAFKNTLFLSISKLLLNTFAAVVVSLLLNEIIIKTKYCNKSLLLVINSKKKIKKKMRTKRPHHLR